MPTLKNNIDLTRNSFAKNIDICNLQAKAIQQTSAVEAMKCRANDPDLHAWHGNRFDEATDVLAWIEDVKKVVAFCPTLEEIVENKTPAVPPVKIEN